MGNQWGLGLHLIFVSIFLFATTYTCLGVKNMTVVCSEEERLALLKFKHSLKNDNNMLTSWVGNDCCRWEGVRCDGATGRVVSLHLRGNARGHSYYSEEYYLVGEEYYLVGDEYYLVGDEVNSSLEELSHLKYLDLSGNDFRGSQIPKFVGSLKQLRYLNLSHSGFGGIIPHHFGNLSNLNVLDLSSFPAQLMADDMAWVSGLSSLKHLDLSDVDLNGAKHAGMVLYMIPTLLELSLSGCGLSNDDLGPHLNSSRTLPNIEHLDLSMNVFTGQLPGFFQNMTSLASLDLSGFNLSQAWSSVSLLNMIPSLSELHLAECGLDNTHLTPTLLNLSTHSNIQHLDLGGNSIEGRFPSLLTNMSSLRALDLSSNGLNSSIPVMPSLIKLELSGNNFKQIEHIGIWRQCHLKELRAMENSFAEEMIGPSTNVSECSQYALEMLNLDANQLNGSIPESLGRLTNLRVLSLQGNELAGPLPEALRRLRLLEELFLSSNQLTGPIPTSLGQLTELDLFDNQFNGSIPESLGRLTALEVLFLDSNRLTGPIPASLGRLASLRLFSASSNLLNGTIPVSIGQLNQLILLAVFNNSLEGVVFEAHFANLSMLKYLYTSSNSKLTFNISPEWIPPFQLTEVELGSCKIAAEFPQWLRTQRKLKVLVLSNASISGPLPTWLRKMPIIPILDLSDNKLSGPLTNLPFGDLVNWPELGYRESLLLQNNLFDGSIPRSLCRRTHLILLDLSRNRLSGKIPRCLKNLRDLRTIIFSSNQLSGVIPSTLGHNSSSLSWLNLNDNNFIGELPRELANFRFLRALNLGDNKFSGNIPRWIGEKLTSLIVLRLHNNSFTGRIPRSLCKNSNLQILDVAHNSLTGHIPRCFRELNGMVNGSQLGIYSEIYFFEKGIYNASNFDADLNVVQVMNGLLLKYTKTLPFVVNMDLSSNKLVGEIPEELTALSLLVGLNLSHNHLSGGIPDSIGNMKKLISLDFSDNHLSGMIPPGMANLNFLSHLNLSYNNLSGRIPTGNQLQTLTDPSIYAGNRDLCGAPLPNDCSNHEDPTTTGKDKYESADEPKKVWFYLDIMCGFATGFWGVIGVLLFKKQWRQKLFMFVEVTMDKMHVAIAVRVAKMKRGREGA